MKLNRNALSNEIGSNISLDPTPCFFIPIIVKCNIVVTMEAQTLVDFSASTCFIYKELMRQYKLVLVEKKHQC
jgi:hypothetical protein